MKEQEYEKLLNIKTTGKQDLDEATIHYNRYEPTEYEGLKKLLENYKVDDADSVIDFGSGKGRLNFYFNYLCNCKVTGIEMNKYYCKEALNNKKSYLEKHKKVKGEKINFICEMAECYKIKEEDNKFYFFNPFSLEIFMKVIDNIIGSVYDYEKTVDLIIFYPSEDYIFFLENYTVFQLEKEIRLDSFKDDNRNRFLIYRLDGRVLN